MNRDPSGEKVTLAYLHRHQLSTNFVESLLRMAVYDKAHGSHLFNMTGLTGAASVIPIFGSTGELAHARNLGAAAFMQTDADWLLWVDDDMGFDPDALEKLLAVADPQERPIVGGLCFIEQELAQDFKGGLRSKLAPTIYDWSWLEADHEGPGRYQLLPRLDYERDKPQRVAATGTGFLLTHRSVFEKISAWCESQGAPGNIWYQRIPGPDGVLSGEDISFCMRAHTVGLPIWVHAGVHVTHQKTVWYGELDYDRNPSRLTEMLGLRKVSEAEWPKLGINRDAVQDAQEKSPTRAKQVLGASEPVAVLVPVMRRPQNARPFMNSLRASLRASFGTAEVTVYAIVDDVIDDETEDAWTAAGAVVIVGSWREWDEGSGADRRQQRLRPGRFSEKINLAFTQTDQPWIFIVGDDVKFHDGWLDQAQDVGRRTGKSVIGTNDLGNPFVMQGRHATHMLIRRSYILERGGGWDGPGIVCHEGYNHWYIDNELVTAAKQRDEWAPCLESVVEHLHPLWGKGDVDDTYRKGESRQREDAILFRDRYAASGKGVA